MNHVVRVSAAMALVGLLAAGCGPAIEADLSPNGKLLVQTGPKGLTIRDTAGGGAQPLLAGSFSEPRFSPDGRTVVVERNLGKRNETLLVDVATHRETRLPGTLRPPFAWRPDGTELVGWDGKVGRVYHLPSRSLVRKVVAPAPPTHARWLPGGRDLAVAAVRSVAVLHDGAITQIPTQAVVATLGYDSARDRVLWTELREADEDQIEMRVLAVARTGGTPTTLLEERNPARLIGAPGAYSYPILATVSPEGNRLALVALVEPKGSTEWEEFHAMAQRLRKNPKNKALAAALAKKSAKLRYDLLVATADLDGKAPATLARRENIEGLADFPQDLVWSADGDRLAVVYRDAVEFLRSH
jgi:hypothetical protein